MDMWDKEAFDFNKDGDKRENEQILFSGRMMHYWANDPRNVGIRSPELYAIPKIGLEELVRNKDIENESLPNDENNDK
jgi:hypothetical protein